MAQQPMAVGSTGQTFRKRLASWLENSWLVPFFLLGSDSKKLPEGQIPKGRLVKGPYKPICIGTVPCISLLYAKKTLHIYLEQIQYIKV